MINEDSTLSHTWDKENMEEYLRYYLEDDTIILTDKQWARISKAVNFAVEVAYMDALDGVVVRYARDPEMPIDPKVQRILGL